MSHGFDETVPHPKPLTAPRRSLTRFEVWAWSPIISFQVGLTASYIALIYFGVSFWISAPPAVQGTTPLGYDNLWAIGLVVGAALAAVGSIDRRKAFEHIERIGASMLSVTVGSFSLLLLWLAYGLGDITRIAGAAGFVALSVPIIIRTMWLWSQLFRK